MIKKINKVGVNSEFDYKKYNNLVHSFNTFIAELNEVKGDISNLKVNLEDLISKKIDKTVVSKATVKTTKSKK